MSHQFLKWEWIIQPKKFALLALKIWNIFQIEWEGSDFWVTETIKSAEKFYPHYIVFQSTSEERIEEKYSRNPFSIRVLPQYCIRHTFCIPKLVQYTMKHYVDYFSNEIDTYISILWNNVFVVPAPLCFDNVWFLDCYNQYRKVSHSSVYKQFYLLSIDDLLVHPLMIVLIYISVTTFWYKVWNWKVFLNLLFPDYQSRRDFVRWSRIRVVSGFPKHLYWSYESLMQDRQNWGRMLNLHISRWFLEFWDLYENGIGNFNLLLYVTMGMW